MTANVRVDVRPKEDNFGAALNAFRLKVQEAGIMGQIRRRRFYLPPHEARRIKAARARRRTSR